MNSYQKIINVCFDVKPKEKVLIITDKNKSDIGKELLKAALEVALEAKMIEIPVGKVNGEEPSVDVAESMKGYDVIIIPTTKSLTHTNAVKRVVEAGARAATLPGITKETIKRAIDVDYEEMAVVTNRLKDILDKGDNARVTTAKGTDISFSIKGRKAKGCNGLIRNKSLLGNLPSGEAFIAPKEGSTDGKIVFDGSILDNIIKEPITVIVKDGFAVQIDGSEELRETLESIKDNNAFNIAELGIGTNKKAEVTGNTLEDEKVLGTAHFAFGKNASFGGIVDVPLHIDGVFLEPTIYIDGKMILNQGKII